MSVPERPSPYYEDDLVTLYHGTCVPLPNEPDVPVINEWLTADVLVTDPPYGIAWSTGTAKWAHGKEPNKGIKNDHDTSMRDGALKRWAAKPGLVFGSLRAEYPAEWSRMLVFQKPLTSGMFGNWSPWRSDWEPIFVTGEWPKQKPMLSSVFSTSELVAGGYNGYATRTGHPHTKPQDVMTRLIESCPPGVVADPFAGSGSTLLAARTLGRKSIGVELDEAYCELIAKRLSSQTLFEGMLA